MNKSIRILLWGMGERAVQLWKYIEKETAKGYISIVAGVDKRSIDFPIPIIKITPMQIKDIEFDYLLITAERAFWDIYDNAILLGIAESRIIHGNIFMNHDFDFFEYERENRLTERIFENVFCDFTYADRDREYHGLDIKILMGRKSYVSRSNIEIGLSPARIRIGNFSSISWNIVFDLGQNMDHDYHRVMNYGMTHLRGIKYTADESDEKSSIEIGSDAWIGKGVVVRGGIKIGNGAVVAANSYVVNDVPDYAIVGGNPARFIKYRFPLEMIQVLKKIKWWEWPTEEVENHIAYFYDINAFLKRFS